jgi:hypothetical protein
LVIEVLVKLDEIEPSVPLTYTGGVAAESIAEKPQLLAGRLTRRCRGVSFALLFPIIV